MGTERPEQIALTALQPRIQRQARDTPDDSLARWASNEVHIVGQLRNAWAHPANRRNVIDRMRNKYLGDFLSVLGRCIRQVAAAIDDTAAANGAVRRAFGSQP